MYNYSEENDFYSGIHSQIMKIIMKRRWFLLAIRQKIQLTKSNFHSLQRNIEDLG